jgi:NAD(P)-dependent dehydrogenase (short-subunit alcohol dehydrogenase family)
MEPIRFDGRVALVTGAGGGLGRTYALELARRGCAVVVNDPGCARDGTGGSAQMADAVVDEIVRAGGRGAASYDGIDTTAGGQAAVDLAVARFGRLDAVIHNAGILRDRSFRKMTEDDWDAVIAVHLKGVFNVCRPAIDAMVANSYGRIVLTASGAGLFGNFGQANYAAAKMGQVGAMQVLNLECAKYGIRVNTISPAAATRMTADVKQASGTPPECVTPAVVYLASEACQESGIIIRAQGGRFSRQAIAFNAGVDFGPEPVSVEDFAAEWPAITDLADARCFSFGDKVAEIIKQHARPVRAQSRA